MENYRRLNVSRWGKKFKKKNGPRGTRRRGIRKKAAEAEAGCELQGQWPSFMWVPLRPRSEEKAARFDRKMPRILHDRESPGCWEGGEGNSQLCDETAHMKRFIQPSSPGEKGQFEGVDAHDRGVLTKIRVTTYMTSKMNSDATEIASSARCYPTGRHRKNLPSGGKGRDCGVKNVSVCLLRKRLHGAGNSDQGFSLYSQWQQGGFDHLQGARQ